MKLRIYVDNTYRFIRGKWAKTWGNTNKCSPAKGGGKHWTEQYLLAIYSVFNGLRIVRILLNGAIGYVQITEVTLEDGRFIPNRWKVEGKETEY
jgi:hypothetical protein